MSTLDQIRESIEARITELQSDMTALVAARAELHGTGATETTGAASPDRPIRQSTQRTPDEPARPPRQRSRSAKSTKELSAAALEGLLDGDEAGLSAITISKRSHAGYRQVLGLLRELETAGQLRRTGTRRTSLWRLVTDEERIAERAAELERLSTRRS
jgi:hypothetical protein